MMWRVGHKTGIKLCIYHPVNLHGGDFRFVNLFNQVKELLQLDSRVTGKQQKHMNRSVMFALLSTLEALDDSQLEICEQIGPALRERGLTFVGIDVIGDYLTEINVTSPTGIQEINRLDGIHIEQTLWNTIERLKL